MAAEQVLDFFLQTMGEEIYKKAIKDTKKLLKEKMGDLEVELDILSTKWSRGGINRSLCINMLLIFWIIIGIFSLYILVFFVLARLFIPFYGFKQYRIPTVIPKTIKDAIVQLEQKAHSPKEYLLTVYNFVQQKWQAERLKTIISLPLAFRTNLEQIWQSPGYAHCLTINFITFILLAKSRYFQEQDIAIS